MKARRDEASRLSSVSAEPPAIVRCFVSGLLPLSLEGGGGGDDGVVADVEERQRKYGRTIGARFAGTSAFTGGDCTIVL